MATTAKKLVYTLQAVYDGKSEIQKLSADLNDLKNIEVFQGMQASFAETSNALVAAKGKMRELRSEMQQPGGEAFARSYEQARNEVARLNKAVEQQKAKLTAARKDLQQSGVAVSELSGRYEELQASSNAAAKVLAAQSKLGIRPLQDVEREIKGLEQAYDDLAASGRLSSKELADAHSTMERRIGKLRQGTDDWRSSIDRAHQGWLGLAGLLAAGTGFAMLTATAAASEKELRNFANTAGMSRSEFAAYAYAVREVGIEQDKLADISKDLKDKIGDFLETGGGEAKDFFENVAANVGLTADELIRMSGPDALIAVKKAMDDANVSAENQVFYLEALANDASLLIPLLENEGKALRDKAAAGRELTGALDELDRESILEVGTAINDMTTAFGTLGKEIVATLAPVIVGIVDGMTMLASGLANMPDSMQVIAVAAGGVTTAFAAWHLGIKVIAGALKSILPDFGAAITKLNSIGTASTLASKAMGLIGRAFGLWAAWDIGYTIGTWLNNFDIVKKAGIALAGGLTKSFLTIKKAWAWVTGGDTAAIQREIDDAERIYTEMFAEVGRKAKETGQVQQAAQQKSADAAKDSAKTQQRVTGEALDAMKKEYERYADEVKRIQEQIAGRSRDLAGELREMARSSMSDANAWQDQQKQAEEYMKVAEEAAAAGDFSTALEYADEAKQLFKGLNQEVKDGDRIIVSQQQALKTAMDGVKDAGELAIDILDRQKESAAKAMESLEGQAGFDALVAGMDDSKRQWLENWRAMREQTMDELDKVERRIVQIVKDRRTTVYVDVVEQRKIGGMIGAMQMAAGGWVKNAANGFVFPGYGGGDQPKNLVMAEDGEVMIRKESVRAAGLKAALAWNAGNFQVVLDELMARFRPSAIRRKLGGPIGLNLPPLPSVQMLAGGGPVVSTAAAAGGTYNVTVNVASGARASGEDIGRQVVSALQRMQRRGSR